MAVNAQARVVVGGGEMAACAVGVSRMVELDQVPGNWRMAFGTRDIVMGRRRSMAGSAVIQPHVIKDRLLPVYGIVAVCACCIVVVFRLAGGVAGGAVGVGNVRETHILPGFITVAGAAFARIVSGGSIMAIGAV
jgi:hypothetical protein